MSIWIWNKKYCPAQLDKEYLIKIISWCLITFGSNRSPMKEGVRDTFVEFVCVFKVSGEF